MASKRKTRLKRFQIGRKAADTKLHAYPNVVGSCFAFKETGGQKTDDLALRVFVSRKLSREELAESHIIPQEVRRHGTDLPTDVVVGGALRPEMGFAIDDSIQIGTSGAFASRGNSVFGLSCAHCLGGPDRNPTTRDPIRIEFPSRGNLLWAGHSADWFIHMGTGVSPDFGAFDAGLVEIESPQVANYVRTRPPLDVFRPGATLNLEGLANMLKYTPVQGWGARTDNIIRGQIDGLFVNYPPYHFDFVVGDPAGAGLTLPGDSGLVWIGPYGVAYGIHIMGDGGDPSGSSVHCFGSFTYRVVDRFRVTLLSA